MRDGKHAYDGIVVVALLSLAGSAIILSAESVFAAATAAEILDERLTPRGWIGAGLIMIGMYVVLAFSPPEQPNLVAAESVSEAHRAFLRRRIQRVQTAMPASVAKRTTSKVARSSGPAK